MAQRSLKVNWFYNTLLNVLKILFPLITVPYISRVLAPEGVGLFNFANTYVSWFAMLAALGIPTYGIREVARVRDDVPALQNLVNQLFSITVYTTAGISLVYLGSILLIPKLSADLAIFLIIGFVLYLTPISTDWYWSGMEDFRYITLRSLIIKTVCTACLFIFVKTRSDLLIYVIIMVLNGVANNVWNFARMHRSGIRPRLVRDGLRQHMRPVMILFASSVAISVYTLLDTVMLGFMKAYDEVAYYTNAANISKMIVSVVTSLAAVTMPRVASCLEGGDREAVGRIAGKSLSFTVFLVFPAAVGLCCLARQFVPLFYGPMFMGTILPLQILSFLIVSIGLSNLVGMQMLVGMGHDRRYLQAIIAGAVLNFVGNCLIIPRLGATGAAISSISAETLILTLMLWYVRRNTFLRLRAGSDTLKSLAGALLLVPLGMLMSRVLHGWTFVLLYMAAGVILYALAELVLHHSAIGVIIGGVRESLIKNGFIRE